MFEELNEDYQDTDPMGLSPLCFPTHPYSNSILTLGENNEICNSLTIETKRALGFLGTMSRNKYQEAKELEEEAYAILATLEIYLINYEQFLFVLEVSKFGSLDFQIIVYDEIEKFRDYDHP